MFPLPPLEPEGARKFNRSKSAIPPTGKMLECET